MNEFFQSLLVAICSNSLLGVLLGFWMNRELQRHRNHLESISSKEQTRFSKYHLDAVDAITRTYALLVDAHNSVFRFCFPDWDGDPILPQERKKVASADMVSFYVYFRKNQIFMEKTTVEHFEKSFHFLQKQLLNKTDSRDVNEPNLSTGIEIYEDMTKTFPGMLEALQSEIRKRIGPETVD